MPKIVDHDAYRAAIVDAAVQSFVVHGYGGLGMRDLARQLGISKSALYHYFPSKEALFRHVVDAVVRSDIAAFDARALTGTTVTQRLAAFVDHVCGNEDWYVQQFLLLTEYVRVRDALEGADEMHVATERYVVAIAVALGVAPDEARALYFQLGGIVMQRVFDGRRTDLRDGLRWIVETLAARHGASGVQS